MRTIQIKRERALANFATPYYFMLDLDLEKVPEKGERDAFLDAIEPYDPFFLPNGASKSMSVDEGEHLLYGIFWTEKGIRKAEPYKIEAGKEDICLTFVTDFDGNHRVSYFWKNGISE
jgi:hypothetical protein